MPGIEREVLRDDGIEALRERRARLGNALPAVGGGATSAVGASGA